MPNIRFGNIDFSGDGAYIWGEGQYSAPARSVDFIEVPGRNGDLLIDNGNYTNTTARFDVVITGDVAKNTARLKNLLYSQKGYQRLYDSDLKGFYRMASFSNGFDISGIDGGIVHLEFDCKPFKYDVLGDEVIEVLPKSGGTLFYNPYFEASRPIIRVYGDTDVTQYLYINTGNPATGSNQVTQIYEIQNFVEIDTEMQDAYMSSINKNDTVSATNLVFNPGENYVSFSGGITRLEITPRWVTI